MGQRREAAVRRRTGSSNGAVLTHDVDHDTLRRETIEGPLQLVVNPVVLKSADEDVVNGRSGDDAQLPQARNRLREWPTGYGNAHAALYEPGDRVIGRTGLSHVPPPWTVGRKSRLVRHQPRSAREVPIPDGFTLGINVGDTREVGDPLVTRLAAP